MKLENVGSIIDDFFEKITPEEVIELFQGLGYEFEPLIENEPYDVLVSIQEESSNSIVHVSDLIETNYQAVDFFELLHTNEKGSFTYNSFSIETELPSMKEDGYIDTDDILQFATAA